LERTSNIAGAASDVCWAFDLFFGGGQGWDRHWFTLILSDNFYDVLATMDEALRDTLSAPKIAENFRCLPEQLLDSLRQSSPD
jgi:hypothetical protein